MKTHDFYYDLPEELIAQTPLERRDASRLMTLDRTTGEVGHRHFYELVDLLNPGDCLVLNNSRVLPARLLGHRVPTMGAVEVLLLKDEGGGVWECLTKPGRKTHTGTELSFGDGALTATVVGERDDGNKLVQFHYEGIFLEVLERLGKMPLPPYIKEELADGERYQTVYSKLRDFERLLASYGVPSELDADELLPSEQKDASLMDAEEALQALRSRTLSGSIRLMRAVSIEQSFSRLLEQAKSEKNLHRIRTDLTLFREYSTYLSKQNKKKLLEMTSAPVLKESEVPADSLKKEIDQKIWVPNPTKATWLALVIPGGGQIYNRKYWKLPIFYGGFAGCAYALTWNSKMYKDYSTAYKDAMNGNMQSSSITDLLPPGYKISETQLKELLRKRKDTYRRYRDLSIFAFIGVYLLSVIDAYVDAELSNFDITPDLSMKVEPAVIDNRIDNSSNRSVGLQCSFRF